MEQEDADEEWVGWWNFGRRLRGREREMGEGWAGCGWDGMNWDRIGQGDGYMFIGGGWGWLVDEAAVKTPYPEKLRRLGGRWFPPLCTALCRPTLIAAAALL